MIATYSEYIREYLTGPGLGARPCPGEHHFVSIYLVPRLFKINTRVPDYINPDGMKKIIGDVAYYRDHGHQFGIEVKLGTVRLTAREFNEWVVKAEPQNWPHTFIGIGIEGIAVCSWDTFRAAYIASVRKTRGQSWKPTEIPKGYGPSKAVNVLTRELGSAQYFPIAAGRDRAQQLEDTFMEALRAELDC